MLRMLLGSAQLGALVSEVRSSCHLHTQHSHADCSNVRGPSTGRFYAALSNLTEGLYTVTSMLPITIPSRSRSHFLDDQEPARPYTLTVLSLGPKTRAYRRNTSVQTVQLGIERFGFWWCNLTHNAPMWPIRGRYECRICGRHHNVPWDNTGGDARQRMKVRDCMGGVERELAESGSTP
jgi:hypothetical protein